ncbi:JAB domain-containing protein [Rhodoligotrophos defluvii]|uniref:JAB domain-containing protein n=1 Tax=Rhodoligotrophos defluvii TaxID=2561934 RepID=UPI001485671D|nr:JAB domain-containing protein [Rhodoligotrophos defluvii]
MQAERVGALKKRACSLPSEIATEGISDKELWEYIVARAVPEGDAFAAAEWILEKHKRLGIALWDCEKLPISSPVVEAVCREIRFMLEVCCRVSRAKLENGRAIKRHSEIIEYCRTRLASEQQERFHLLCFNTRFTLMADEALPTRQEHDIGDYHKTIAHRSLHFGSSAIVLAQNRPCGDPAPSQRDVQLTQDVVKCLKPLGISVLDHVIVARGLVTSFQQLGVL